MRAPGRAAAWQEGIDAALGARDVHAQWCMASPADFAQVSRLRNITSIRTSGDHGYLVGPEVLWAWFLHTNVIARALGLWPYKDVFHSAAGSETREVEALLSALSAGPVGVGDRVGEADPALIRRTCRADGVLVRPDVPVAAIDRAVFDAPVWTGELLTGSAHTDHAAGRWGYVVTANVGMEPRRTRRGSRSPISVRTCPRPIASRCTTGGAGTSRCCPRRRATRSRSIPPNGTTACSRRCWPATSR